MSKIGLEISTRPTCKRKFRRAVYARFARKLLSLFMLPRVLSYTRILYTRFCIVYFFLSRRTLSRCVLEGIRCVAPPAARPSQRRQCLNLILLFQKMKNLNMRKRNNGNPGKLTRVLSQKSLNSSILFANNSPPAKSPSRTFLLETPVQFTTVRRMLLSSYCCSPNASYTRAKSSR